LAKCASYKAPPTRHFMNLISIKKEVVYGEVPTL
jgi:hypothetical protein